MGYIDSASLAKKMMKLWEARPSPKLSENLHLEQVFRTTEYLNGGAQLQAEIRHKHASWGYEYERDNDLFAHYFGSVDLKQFAGKRVLDLGCSTGGRLTRWVEKYGFASGVGLDINEIYAAAGNAFAKKMGINAIFDTARGEELPYENGSFDFVIASDVFEHVEDLRKVMDECHRVLKPGGRLFCVFPQFYQPLESHFGLITKMPGLHWVFTARALTTAFDEIEKERGEGAYWYARNRTELLEWEKLYGLNGTTVRVFRKLINRGGWKVRFSGHSPILSDGRKAKLLPFRMLRLAFVIPARLPWLEELFLGRVVYVLENGDK